MLTLFGTARGSARTVWMLVAMVAVLLAAANAPAQKAVAYPPEFNKTEMAEYLRYVNLWPKELKLEFGEAKASAQLPGFFDLPLRIDTGQAVVTQMYLLSADGQHLIRAQAGDRLGKTVFGVGAYPFATEQEKLKLEGRPSSGPADAPVTVAVFSDFQCGFCREEAKILRSNLLSAYPGKVRLVFMDFPLAQIHDWAHAAAVAGRCVMAQDAEKFWAYHDWAFEEQPALTKMNFTEKFTAWAGQMGLDGLQLSRCQQDPSVNQAVSASFQQALDLGLTSTPTLFVNGRQIGGKLEWNALKQVVDAELEYQTAAAKKKEECCTVSVPGIFPQ